MIELQNFDPCCIYAPVKTPQFNPIELLQNRLSLNVRKKIKFLKENEKLKHVQEVLKNNKDNVNWKYSRKVQDNAKKRYHLM